MTLHAHCQCGHIQITVNGSLQHRIHCYCTICRRIHGADYSAWVSCLRSDFEIVSGQDQIRIYRSSPGVERSFCATCGSVLIWHDESEFNRRYVAFAEGLLTEAAGELELIEHFRNPSL